MVYALWFMVLRFMVYNDRKIEASLSLLQVPNIFTTYAAPRKKFPIAKLL